MIKKISFLMFLAWNTTFFGQVTNQSPYSFFGIGENNQQISIASAGMGGISVALNRTHELNFANPALLSNVQYTLFDIGVKTQFLTLKDASQTQNSSFTSLSYLTAGFPITNKMGFMVGLQPNSNVGYNIAQEIYDTDDEILEANLFNGNGGTNRFFMGVGIQAGKGLSIGAETEFIFGSIENNVINQRAEAQLYTRYRNQSQISGVGIKLGGAYQTEIKKGLELNIESSIKLANDIHTESDNVFYTFLYSTYGTESPQDTLFSNEAVKGKISRPLAFHSGIGVGNPDIWYAGIEYNMQNALEFDTELMSNSKIKYTNRSQIAVGGYYLPKKNSISSYWQRVIYRAGVRFENPGISLDVDGPANSFSEMKDFGISFGLGLPVGNQLTRLNVSVEYGKRGETSQGLIQENYVNLRLGLNLAEKWFQKSKIN
jgi:hypothetical protein